MELMSPPNAKVQLRAHDSTRAMKLARRKISPGEKPNAYHALVCCNYR